MRSRAEHTTDRLLASTAIQSGPSGRPSVPTTSMTETALPREQGTHLAYSVDGVAKKSNTGRTTIYEEIRAGRLKARKVTPPAIVFQARRLSLRFGFSPELASVLAELAFQTTGRRA